LFVWFTLHYQDKANAFQQDLVDKFIAALNQAIVPIAANTEATGRQTETLVALCNEQARLTDAINVKKQAN